MGASNLHTHTIYCDGKNTPEELITEALRMGCPRIGFSGHSYTFFDESYCMSKEGTKRYKAEIAELKEKYAGRIEILLGVEQDYYSEEPTDDYDYVIGSVHYVKHGGQYLTVDESRERQMSNVEKYYGGDYYKFISDYYETVGGIYEKTKCDIVGHFDLVTKFNGDGSLFDETSAQYRQAVSGALERLVNTPTAFEINTGAVSRGYRSHPYPERSVIEYLKSKNKTLIYTSDCHKKEFLTFGLPSE